MNLDASPRRTVAW